MSLVVRAAGVIAYVTARGPLSMMVFAMSTRSQRPPRCNRYFLPQLNNGLVDLGLRFSGELLCCGTAHSSTPPLRTTLPTKRGRRPFVEGKGHVDASTPTLRGRRQARRPGSHRATARKSKHTIVCDEPKPYWRRNRFMGWILVVPAGSRRGVVQIRRLCRQLVHTVNMAVSATPSRRRPISLRVLIR